MKNALTITGIACCALFAVAVHADDQTPAQKAPATTMNKNAPQTMGNAASDKKAMNSAEGAHDSTANKDMKAGSAEMNKSEGANDRQH
jgi:hypothetical protein